MNRYQPRISSASAVRVCQNGKGSGAEFQYTFKDCDNYGHMGSLPCEKCNEYLTEQLRNKIKERKEKIKQKRINRQVI